MYKILSHKKAVKYYRRLDDKTAKKVNKVIEEISKQPYSYFHTKRLKGKLEGKYRCEVGDLRIVYVIDEGKKTVLIDAIGPRGDIYK